MTTVLSDKDYNDEEILKRLNFEEASKRLPLIIYLGCLCVIGIFGNVHVLMFCRFKLHTRSNYRTFIMCLAFLDLLNCCVAMPFEIADSILPYTFNIPFLCQFLRGFNTFVTIGSTCILEIIAVERYWKICRPLQVKMSKSKALHVCLAGILISVVMSLPQAIFNGKKTVYLQEVYHNVTFNFTILYNVTGCDCSISDEFAKSIWPQIYYGLMNIGIIAAITSIVTVYSLIGRKISTALSRYRGFLSSSLTSPNGSISSNVAIKLTPIADNEANKAGSKESKKTPVNSDDSDYPEVLDNVFTDETKENQSCNRNCLKIIAGLARQWSSKKQVSKKDSEDVYRQRQNSLHEKRMIKTTKILFLITIVFVMCYIPVLVLLITAVLKRGFSSNLSYAGKILYSIGIRLIFLNNVINPFIYAFYDKHFRKYCFTWYKSLFSKCICRNKK